MRMFALILLASASLAVWTNDRWSTVEFHNSQQLSNGVWTGTLGAMTYLLQDGKPVSNGYHSIEPSNNGYTAKLGARTFKLDRNGRVTY